MRIGSLLLTALLAFTVTAAAVELPELNWVPGSDWINVKDLGAKGDGKTDDTAALQRALDSVNDGSVLYLPPGDYIITKELRLRKAEAKVRFQEKRFLGLAIHGSGRNTRLIWHGPENGTMLREMGSVHCRYYGLSFDGRGVAAIGINHDNDNKFETHVYHEFLAFRNFRDCALVFENNKIDGLSTAETAVLHSIFDNCNTATRFTSFNDYNFTFDGCYFLNNKNRGVECINGNFYVRNSRFENNGVDIFCNPEHASSVRRSISIGSGRFVEFGNGVTPLSIQNCLVVDWTGPEAVKLNGAPVTMFDNVFDHQSDSAIAFASAGNQPLLLANNRMAGKGKLTKQLSRQAVELKLPGNPLKLDRNTQFMPQRVKLPTKLFDAKRDFGAKGDGKTDDTAALQRTIDAARKAGNGAIAYLPSGDYRITKTLEVAGRDYWVGGTGPKSAIWFNGSTDVDAMAVRPEGDLRIDGLSVGRQPLRLERQKPVDFKGNGADIRQYPSPRGSRVDYHSVYTVGKYVFAPFILGLRLENLKAHDTVVINNCEGNLQALNSGAATILATISYEGTVWIRGTARGGFFGVLTRLATQAAYSLYLEDNQNFVASDFYIEQSEPETITLKGSAELPAGRVTAGFVKLDQMVRMNDYRGDVNLVATQFYRPKDKVKVAEGTGLSRLGLFGCYFYLAGVEIGGSVPTALLASASRSEFNQAELKINTVGTDPQQEAIQALLDLRRLGELDWKLRQ